MLAVTLDGYALSALIVVTLAIVFVVVVAARLIRRDHDVRVARFGVFVERERFGGDRWTPDPLDSPREQETRPAPLPPPTPPPPLPPRPDPDPAEATEAWPQREESP